MAPPRLGRCALETLEARWLLSGWTITGQVQIYTPGVLGPIYGPSPGSVVYVDSNENGMLDPGEASAAADANGNFALNGSGSGTFIIREQPPPDGTHYKSDETGFRNITISDGQTVSGIVFANSQEATVSGTVFEDLNGNGLQDPGEPGLSGWNIDNGNPDIPGASSDSSGHYSMPLFGGRWFIRLQSFPEGPTDPVGQGAGWVVTAPLGTAYLVTITGRDVTNLNFGLKQMAAPGTAAPDLTTRFQARVPSVTYGGERVRASLRLTNSGNALAAANVQFTVYASNTTNQVASRIASDAMPVDVFSRPLNLAPGESKTVNIFFKLPVGLPAGTYSLWGVANSNYQLPESDDGNNAAAGATFTQAASTADLSLTFARQPPLSLAIGHLATMVLDVKNLGRLGASGAANIRVYASADQSLDSGDTLLTAATVPIRLGRARSRRVRLRFTVPSIAAGNYFVIGSIIPGITPPDANSSNDVAVSSAGTIVH